MFQPVRC